MRDLSPVPRDPAISPYSGRGLATHLAIVVMVKILALTLLWAFFFRTAP